MTEETLEKPTAAADGEHGNSGLPENQRTDTAARGKENASSPEFNELRKKQTTGASSPTDLKRLHEVQVTVSAELGRTKVPIQELLKLTEGSVFELNRSINSPVELLAQGVPLGNGEVVVVDDQFAIRLLEIYARP